MVYVIKLWIGLQIIFPVELNVLLLVMQCRVHQKILCGVPQGSILEALLFIIYKNDIVKSSVLFKLIMFADDTNLFLHHDSLNDLVEIIHQELDKVPTWLKINKLSVNKIC